MLTHEHPDHWTPEHLAHLRRHSPDVPVYAPAGVAAAVGTRHASNRWPSLGVVARRAPYLSGLLIIAVGIYVGLHGWAGLSA